MGRDIGILELHNDENTWIPPEIDLKEKKYVYNAYEEDDD